MSSRKIVIAGGTGFVGRRLATALADAADDIVVLTRHSPPGNASTSYEAVPPARPSGGSTSAFSAGGHVRYVTWDAVDAGGWATELDGAFAVVNLTGESVAQRWTPEAKRRIRNSRVKSVQAICSAVCQAKTPPERWINASATGIYGDRGDETVTEESPLGHGFLAETCVEWERAFFDCPIPTAKTAVRIGFVLGPGGALPQLTKLARQGLGGAAGSGRQPISWIHLDDLSGIIQWLLNAEDPPPVANATAPNPVNNREFMRSLRKVVGARFGLPAPAILVRLAGMTIGPDADLILSGVRARPIVLEDRGFSFAFPNIDQALANVAPK